MKPNLKELEWFGSFCMNMVSLLGDWLGYKPVHLEAYLEIAHRKATGRIADLDTQFPGSKAEYERCLALLESVHNEHSPTKGELQ